MKDKNKLEVLLKVIQRAYAKSPGMQEVIYPSVIELYAEEGVSPEQLLFIFLLSLSQWPLKKKI